MMAGSEPLLRGPPTEHTILQSNNGRVCTVPAPSCSSFHCSMLSDACLCISRSLFPRAFPLHHQPEWTFPSGSINHSAISVEGADPGTSEQTWVKTLIRPLVSSTYPARILGLSEPTQRALPSTAETTVPALQGCGLLERLK